MYVYMPYDGIMKLRGAENRSIRPKIYLIRASGKKTKDDKEIYIINEITEKFYRAKDIKVPTWRMSTNPSLNVSNCHSTSQD